MYLTNQKRQQKQQRENNHHRKPLRPPLANAFTSTSTSASATSTAAASTLANESTIFTATYQKQEQYRQPTRHQNYHLRHHYHYKHNHNHSPSIHHQLLQQHLELHCQKPKTRHYFSRSGLVFLIFLSVIKESLTTTYSTSYSSSLDVTTTTTVSPTNLLPYFDFDVPRNITVTVGQTGFLHCRVERLGDKDVSWIRKRDLHILTAGSTTYTSDQRFQVLRPENSGNWTLQIKYPQPRDSGIYECQINTEPKMSLSYTFNVVELKATIIGPTDLYVKSGSDINLTCKIMQGPHELGNIFWYKGSEIIDMTTNQNEIDSGKRITVENDWSDGLTSRLKIRRASSSDTGNYTCVPTIAKSSSVYVHVIIGEHPAAMQHNSSTSMHFGNFYLSLCCMLFTIVTCCLQHLMCTNRSNTNNISFSTNANNTNKITIKLLAKKRPTQATSTTPSLTMKHNVAVAMENATSALDTMSAVLVAATITSATVITIIKDMKRIPAVSQSKQCILSSATASVSASASASASSACFYTSTTTKAAVVKTVACKRTSLSTACNGSNSR